MARDKGTDQLPPKLKLTYPDLEPGREFIIQKPGDPLEAIVFGHVRLDMTKRGKPTLRAVIHRQGAGEVTVSLTKFMNGRFGRSRVIGAQPLEDFITMNPQTGERDDLLESLGTNNVLIVAKNDPELPVVPAVISSVSGDEVVLGSYEDMRPMLRVNVVDLKQGGTDDFALHLVPPEFSQRPEEPVDLPSSPRPDNNSLDTDVFRDRFIRQRQEDLLSRGEGIEKTPLLNRDGTPVGADEEVELVVRDPGRKLVLRVRAMYEGVAGLTGDALFVPRRSDKGFLYVNGVQETLPNLTGMLKIPISWFNGHRPFAVLVPVI